MNKSETKNYIPLEIEVVEVLMEKGYAASGEALNEKNGNGFDYDF